VILLPKRKWISFRRDFVVISVSAVERPERRVQVRCGGLHCARSVSLFIISEHLLLSGARTHTVSLEESEIKRRTAAELLVAHRSQTETQAQAGIRIIGQVYITNFMDQL